jgi:hypothetical protein
MRDSLQIVGKPVGGTIPKMVLDGHVPSPVIVVDAETGEVVKEFKTYWHARRSLERAGYEAIIGMEAAA